MSSSFDPKARQVFAVNLEQQEKSRVVVSCLDYGRYYAVCANKIAGWVMPLPADSPFVRQIRASNRQFTEHEMGVLIEFRFAPGQECFGHRVITAPPRLTHFNGETEFASWSGSKPVSSITPVMRRNAKVWEPGNFMEKFHEESDKREELLRKEGLSNG